MRLKPESPNEPFQPYMVLYQEGKRSAIPNDFRETDLAFFETILQHINDYRLKSRIADLLWLVKKPRNHQHALSAIDSYQQFPLDAENLLIDGKQAWNRAIALSRQVNNNDRIQNISHALFTTFNNADFSEKNYALWLSDILDNVKLDEAKSKLVAEKLESFAHKAKDNQDWPCAREYFIRSKKWLDHTNSKSNIISLTVEIAETYVSEAEKRTHGSSPSQFVAGHFYGKAIHAYREIPRNERGAFNVDDRISDLNKKMNVANNSAIIEMKPISTQPIDISDTAKSSRDSITGRNLPEVLIALANISQLAKVDKLREESIKSFHRYPLSNLFPTTYMTRDGRVIAKSSCANMDDIDSPETNEAIMDLMIRDQDIRINLTVKGQIVPALQVINAEHRITEEIMLSLCHYSSVIPQGREEFWAKGLFYGFEMNFIVSTHLLIPQLEHFVRMSMKQKNIKTTTLDSKGIETENGLSALLDNPDVEKAIEKNLLFEFKSLLTLPMGPNLRNEMAHGLMEVHSAMSIYACYLWWLCLHMVIKSIPWEVQKNACSDYTI